MVNEYTMVQINEISLLSKMNKLSQSHFSILDPHCMLKVPTCQNLPTLPTCPVSGWYYVTNMITIVGMLANLLYTQIYYVLERAGVSSSTFPHKDKLILYDNARYL